MREIKFRAWSFEDEFMYECVSVATNRDNRWITMIKNVLGYITSIEGEYELMQYTGLKDCDGNGIYEGDILKFSHLENYANELQVVSGDRFMWGSEEYSFLEIVERGYEFKVVGNIYENKEGE